MILVFGGTTEGRKAAEVLEEGGSPYFYSTKTGEQDLTLHHGQRIDGALDAEAMQRFCRENNIRLIVDAAHPFAAQLHQTIAEVSDALKIPAIRYERIFPERDASQEWLDSYEQVPHDIKTLLATTGVQSISKLKPLEAKGVKVIYRILPRESSIALAKSQGATEDQLCYYAGSHALNGGLASRQGADADAILLKESGLSGGFQEKVDAAKAKGMRILVLKRPETPSLFKIVNGPYGLRRAVEKLLPEFYPLHSGLTTGTCATAAAVAATIRLLKKEMPEEVPVILPDGETIYVPVSYGEGYASCFKEAGDDPDVTNGIEVRVSVEVNHGDRSLDSGSACHQGPVPMIHGGEGVGTITLPGFDYPPGSPAINKAPREMIRQNIERVIKELSTVNCQLSITISVPQGAEIAKKTFNPRLGIEGGISIIGVSGIVKPFSEEAFIDSIRKCMTIAKASGSERVVINSGGKSERFVKGLYPDLPAQAFVEYGNYIGETLKIAHELDIRQVTLGVMLGKAVKLAAGHLDTHSRRATMDKVFVQQLLDEALCDVDITPITLARELWDLLPAEKAKAFAQVIITHCATHCRPLLPNGSLTILLITDEGKVYQAHS